MWWRITMTVAQLRLDLDIRAMGGPTSPEERAEEAWTRLMAMVER